MKQRVLFLSLALVAFGIVAGCKGKSSAKPVSELIRKRWTANIVKENTTEVYKKGAASNTKPGYSSFVLDLSGATGNTVRITFVDGSQSVGTWELSSDNKTLTLKDLSPPPTGTNGTIVYTINGTVTDSQLSLTRTTPDPKTGNTTNEYQLVNP
jgi:hypothetical protein